MRKGLWAMGNKSYGRQTIMCALTTVIVAFMLSACQPSGKEQGEHYFELRGPAQGTTYQIIYQDSLQRNFQEAIDSILSEIDSSLSTYIESSLISRFNRTDSVFTPDAHLLEMFLQSRKIHLETGGAFDPAIKPLLTLWGFGTQEMDLTKAIDSAEIAAVKLYAGMNQLLLKDAKTKTEIHPESQISCKKNYILVKQDPRAELDFNAIAQGYTVDLIAAYFKRRKVRNYMIEIGGEVSVKGKNQQGESWKIGIDKPEDNASQRTLRAIVKIRDKSIVTSGNYRKFYIRDGVKYAHTIDPKTGFPVQHSLLSATVIADDCASADAYATAFMVLGYEKAKSFLRKHPDLQGYLIYANEDGSYSSWMSEGLQEWITELDN